MSHLPTERLAALADEQPTAEELAHLATCAGCARERAAYRSLLAMAEVEQTRIGVPITSWESLRGSLVEEGAIVREPLRLAGGGPARRHVARRFVQIAAGLVLMVGGVVAGRVSAGASVLPTIGADSTAHVATTSSDVSGAAATPASFASREEALAARDEAELKYQSASAFLAMLDSSSYAPTSPAAIRTRLAALDRVDQTMREALYNAPGDPVINSYYLTTLGEREATLRQLSTTLPEAVRLNSF